MQAAKVFAASGCAKRFECAELAPALGRAVSSESASKLVALQTLRAIWVRLSPRCGMSKMSSSNRSHE
jgi:hypothetical protein